jgi:DHA1 family bicyclomycin/chloramphenicol resistance-like MFS transporter
MAFIGASAYIYQEFYGLSSTIYSLFFGFNAICMMTGPFVFMLMSKRLKRSTIILICLIVCVASGIAMVGFASLGPIAFALSVMPSFVATSAIKPPGLHLMLEQQKSDTGSASSLIVFGNMVMGSIGIGCASIAIWDFAHLVGLLTLILSAFTLVLWIGPGKKLTKHTD